jgi:hypothetical protein
MGTWGLCPILCLSRGYPARSLPICGIASSSCWSCVPLVHREPRLRDVDEWRLR